MLTQSPAGRPAWRRRTISQQHRTPTPEPGQGRCRPRRGDPPSVPYESLRRSFRSVRRDQTRPAGRETARRHDSGRDRFWRSHRSSISLDYGKFIPPPLIPRGWIPLGVRTWHPPIGPRDAGTWGPCLLWLASLHKLTCSHHICGGSNKPIQVCTLTKDGSAGTSTPRTLGRPTHCSGPSVSTKRALPGPLTSEAHIDSEASAPVDYASTVDTYRVPAPNHEASVVPTIPRYLRYPKGGGGGDFPLVFIL